MLDFFRRLSSGDPSQSLQKTWLILVCPELLEKISTDRDFGSSCLYPQSMQYGTGRVKLLSPCFCMIFKPALYSMFIPTNFSLRQSRWRKLHTNTSFMANWDSSTSNNKLVRLQPGESRISGYSSTRRLTSMSQLKATSRDHEYVMMQSLARNRDQHLPKPQRDQVYTFSEQ